MIAWGIVIFLIVVIICVTIIAWKVLEENSVSVFDLNSTIRNTERIMRDVEYIKSQIEQMKKEGE